MFELHIEDFYKDCSRALLTLHHNFPRKTTLYVEDLSGPDQPDEYGIHSDRHMSCLGALIWLEEEGFIRYQDKVRQEALDECSLTAKAVNLLTVSVKELAFSRALGQLIGLDTLDQFEGQPSFKLIEYLHQSGTSTQLAATMRHCLTKYTAENEFTAN